MGVEPYQEPKFSRFHAIFTARKLSTGEGKGFGFPACITGQMTGAGGLHLVGGGSASRGVEVCIWGRGSAFRERWVCIWGRGFASRRGMVGYTPWPELGKQLVHILLECFLVFKNFFLKMWQNHGVS